MKGVGLGPALPLRLAFLGTAEVGQQLERRAPLLELHLCGRNERAVSAAVLRFAVRSLALPKYVSRVKAGQRFLESSCRRNGESRRLGKARRYV